MTCYITDGTNYLCNNSSDSPRISKKKGNALKFPDEKSAFPIFIDFRAHLPDKVKKRWSIEKTKEAWIEPKYFYLRSVRGYLTPNNEVSPNKRNAGIWEEAKIENLLRNQCATHPNLKKLVWEKVPVLETPDSSKPVDIRKIDPGNTETDTGQPLPLFPFASGEFTIRSSRDFLDAFLLFYQDIEERKVRLTEELSHAEQQLLIVEHAIELNDYSPEEEHHLILLIRQLRMKRRQCKDEQFLVNCFLKQIAPDILTSIQQEASLLKDRYYTVREFPELFRNSENAIFSTIPASVEPETQEEMQEVPASGDDQPSGAEVPCFDDIAYGSSQSLAGMVESVIDKTKIFE